MMSNLREPKQKITEWEPLRNQSYETNLLAHRRVVYETGPVFVGDNVSASQVAVNSMLRVQQLELYNLDCTVKSIAINLAECGNLPSFCRHRTDELTATN